ncbi:glycosyltransferase family 39 protein [Amycolatopsis mediterranei]|uniref:glycosyltransferase family 39 protein n=2 Tax=Amycolatopsis mediterranei TaxID=33910 RepID=UPI00049F248B|nr:glycosyltransferase family 39 protein [Amycolatopsis mediterranei]KDO12387.1 glycosyl transferase [Amycolatopsis mediterranei]KDU91593.1 glycosyl transferase [Amycolatopsis mediterranei]UZF71020.1 glycosyltransferase family 39 protein [Amycolatopsis mediterranei]
MTTTLSAPEHAQPQPPAPARKPRWVRPSVAALLAGTALLYLWDLAKTGWANDFYAMAAQAGTWSWKALFFGSLDPGNVVTVDKPPFSLWIMGLSGRLFGFSSWSLLVPNALAGVASVGLLYLAVRRLSGPGAGLLAGAGLALTPVAALMFRYDNPDAFLVLLLVAGAYCVVRALEHASTKWLLLAGVAIGFGFLDKMLQAFLVLPAFVLVYAVAAPTSLGRRIGRLFAAAGAVLVSAGWWIAAVALWPVADRPYISGSTDNSVLELAFGYNGLGRIFGEGRGGRAVTPPAGIELPAGGELPGGGRGFGGGFGGQAGLTRLFGGEFGGEASWLLPAAVIGLVAGLWFTRRAPRTDRTRAALLLWGGWLVVTALVFSYMSGIIHPYYTVALAPGIVATLAISTRELWRGRANFAARAVLAVMLAVTAVWAFVLLARTPDWQPWVRYALLGSGAAAVGGLLFGADRVRRLGPVVAVLGLCGALLGTTSFTLATAATAHAGGTPSSGPSVASGRGFGGGARGFGAGETDSAVIDLLKGTTTKWAAAQSGAMQSAGLALASGRPVLAIGGFSGSDPAPTLQQFRQYVADGDIRYFVAGGRGGFGGGRGTAGEIQAWVEQNFAPLTVGGTTVYDLTKSVD